jgi:hypothetical protein
MWLLSEIKLKMCYFSNIKKMIYENSLFNIEVILFYWNELIKLKIFIKFSERLSLFKGNNKFIYSKFIALFFLLLIPIHFYKIQISFLK